MATFFRPISTDFCPSGTRVGAYQCDFRSVAQSTTVTGVALSIPSNLPTLYVKAWGGGGGAYDGGIPESSGGAGGFSEALFQTISGTALAGANLDVIVGAGGTGSTTATTGGGGGGASGVRRTSGTVLGLAAGAGGGASYSDLVTGGCSATVGTDTQCGLGGGGGGAGSASTALTSRAPDATGVCGGKGGDNTPSGTNPTNATYCSLGGTDATTSAGGAGTGSAGGSSAIGAGGAGFVSGSYIGAGGGGGGHPLGGEGGGYSSTAASGFGGGGGSGHADADAVNVSGEASGLVGSTTYAVDNTRVGDIDHDHPTMNRRINNILPNLSGNPWAVNDFISGSGIPSGARIASIQNQNIIFIDMDPTASGIGVALTVTSQTGTVTYTSETGGDDDFDYAPDYLDDTPTLQTPGRGGVGGDVNGRAGAVVLKW